MQGTRQSLAAPPGALLAYALLGTSRSLVVSATTDSAASPTCSHSNVQAAPARDDLGGELAQIAALASGEAAEHFEGHLGGRSVAGADRTLGLLDDDTGLQGALELSVLGAESLELVAYRPQPQDVGVLGLAHAPPQSDGKNDWEFASASEDRSTRFALRADSSLRPSTDEPGVTIPRTRLVRISPSCPSRESPSCQEPPRGQADFGRGVEQVDGRDSPAHDEEDVHECQSDSTSAGDGAQLRRYLATACDRVSEAAADCSDEDADRLCQPEVRLRTGHTFERASVHERPDSRSDVEHRLRRRDLPLGHASRRRPGGAMSSAWSRPSPHCAGTDSWEPLPLDC